MPEQVGTSENRIVSIDQHLHFINALFKHKTKRVRKKASRFIFYNKL